ncbi:MAG: bifunctional hydroxymethylpyrimidine kinase/phosphomethylpyrimidine kinase [Planctomycetia bacterium]|nr:bifunctional hydroxymethylpyrimidine kinase/phosphomethylpyrimidine kinase [Planctomycetia bacterium]
MILAAGLSPAWQQIVLLERLNVGEVNRAREVHWCASGKVLNVGLALKCLSTSPPLNKGGAGGVAGKYGVRIAPEADAPCNSECGIEVRTLATVGGSIGGAIRRQFLSLEVPARWIETESPTRVCTTILDAVAATTTELVQNAPAITDDELEQFAHAYREEARDADLIVLTGSLPAGVPATFYRDLLAETQGRVVLDAQHEPLLAALEARPFVVKPNREELGRTLGRSLLTDEQVRDAIREICRRGATWAVVSEGKERVWIGSEQALLWVKPPPVAVVNPIGSGDCLAAGIAMALTRGEDVPDAVCYGMAAAAENVGQLLPARLDPQRVADLIRKVVVQTI